MANNSLIILGIDPGTATTGFGIIKVNKKKDQNPEIKCLDFGIITTEKNDPREQRLREIHNQIIQIIRKTKPDIMAIESVFFFKNQKTACKVSEARGVILLAAAKKNLQTIGITPLEMKMGICNYGRASKKQVQRMVKKIVGLKNLPKPDDAADALAVAISSWYKLTSKYSF